jgi:phosphotransferase system HPr-like phosphotransfer protein
VLAVMQLGASSGQQITVRATGPDASDTAATMIRKLTGAH